ncbi:MAG: universal stress protein [Betaproteobacteria bacterium]|nr:universal stress protein [Betaproteobacteria bacterium]
MSYKTILVHLDTDKRVAERLDLAIRLADTFDSHLVGLFALSAPRIPSYALAEAGPVVVEVEARHRAEAARNAEAMFKSENARHGRSAEWRATQRDALAAATLSARYADLVVIGQHEPGNSSGVTPDFAEELVLSAGRPVLLVPYAGHFAQVGRRILVAWNAGQEAARAVTDALPLLTRASTVQVVAFNPAEAGADHGDIPGADIGLVLARHGVKVSVAQQQSEEVDIGNQLLSRAADIEADLIVMGAYGHSRVRELVLGGVTRTLLDTMTVPVLMSH